MNFVIFHAETLRADLCYNPYPSGAKTPNLDKFRREGITFDNCFSQSPFCTPSRCSMFTGLYPHVNGHRNISHLLHAHEPNLFSTLRKNGYKTAVYGKNDLTDPDSTRQSFDEFQRTVEAEGDPDAHMEWSSPRMHKAFHYGERVCDGIAKDNDWANVQSGIDFMSRHKYVPFCLFVPLVFAHPPYFAEKPFYMSHRRDEIDAPIPPDFSRKPGVLKDLYEFQEHGKLSQKDFREIKGMYMDMISRVDMLFGLLLDSVSQLGLKEDTTIVFTSDHGDFAGDYGLTEKWNNGTEDCLVHIPLVIRVPGEKGGEQRKGFVEGLDLYSTVLDLAGVSADNYHFSKNLLHMNSDREAVFCESGYNQDEVSAATYSANSGANRDDFYKARGEFSRAFPQHARRKVMIRTQDYKLVYSEEAASELYNMRDDPDELNNLISDPGCEDIVTDLQHQLLSWYLKTSDNTPLVPDSRKFPDS